MNRTGRYHFLLINIHWVMAGLIFISLGSGFLVKFISFSTLTKYHIIQVHKSVGVLVLMFVAVRLLSRWLTLVPVLPSQLSLTEKKLALVGHFALYLLILLVTFSGWVMISASDLSRKTMVFGLFQWPNLFFISPSSVLRELSQQAHFYQALILLALIIGHVLAVFKHERLDKIPILSRMTAAFANPILILCFTGMSVAAITLLDLYDIGFKKNPSYVERKPESQSDLIERHLVESPANDRNEDIFDQEYQFFVDKQASKIAFSGVHDGDRFEGYFQNWDVSIVFNPDQLEKSHISAVIDLSSADTGVSLYNETLLEADWFGVAPEPAQFHSSKIVRLGSDQYQVEGKLGMKGAKDIIGFSFNLSDLNQDPVTAEAILEVNRLGFNIGVATDPDAEWVSESINVEISITASKKSAEISTF